MKKRIALILAFLMIFGISGCGGSAKEQETPVPETMAEAEQGKLEATEEVQEIISEKEVESVKIPVLTKVSVMWLSRDIETEELRLNEKGLIETIVVSGNTITVEYDENDRICSLNNWNNANSEKGCVETWNYDGDYPVSSSYSPKGIYRNARESVYQASINEAGLPEQWIVNTTYTDLDDNSVSKDSEKLEIEYDDAGRASAVQSYLHGNKLDHTEIYEYDVLGNLANVVFRGGDLNIYLRYSFTYELVELNGFETTQLNGFQAYLNTAEVLNAILDAS